MSFATRGTAPLLLAALCIAPASADDAAVPTSTAQLLNQDFLEGHIGANG